MKVATEIQRPLDRQDELKEHATIERLHAGIEAAGLRPIGRHHGSIWATRGGPRRRGSVRSFGSRSADMTAVPTDRRPR